MSNDDILKPAHHSADQLRSDGGQWRPSAGQFDHAGAVPVATLSSGEQVPIINIAVQVDNRLVQANVADEIARVFALPSNMVRDR